MSGLTVATVSAVGVTATALAPSPAAPAEPGLPETFSGLMQPAMAPVESLSAPAPSPGATPDPPAAAAPTEAEMPAAASPRSVGPHLPGPPASMRVEPADGLMASLLLACQSAEKPEGSPPADPQAERVEPRPEAGETAGPALLLLPVSNPVLPCQAPPQAPVESSGSLVPLADLPDRPAPTSAPEPLRLESPAVPEPAFPLPADPTDVPAPQAAAWAPVTAAVAAPNLIQPAMTGLAIPPVDTGGLDWPQPLAERIHWQLDSGVQEARIELAPEGLGPVDLRVQVEGGQVRLHIGAAHAATRDLLGEALPRLRELLGDSGLSLGQASVSSQQQRPNPSLPTWKSTLNDEPETLEAPVVAGVRRSRGLFDHYA